MAGRKHTIDTCLNTERQRIDALPDTVDAARHASTAIEVIQQELNEFAELRSSLFCELRFQHGWSLGDIAREFGITRARVAQLTTA